MKRYFVIVSLTFAAILLLTSCSLFRTSAPWLTVSTDPLNTVGTSGITFDTAEGTEPIISDLPVTDPVTTAPKTEPVTSTDAITDPPAPVTTEPRVTTEPPAVTTPKPNTEKPPVTSEKLPDPNGPKVNDNELVKISDYLPEVLIDMPYSGSDNSYGLPIYRYTDAYIRYGTLRRLNAVYGELKEKGYGLKIWDAWRPVSAQFELWGAIPKNSSFTAITPFSYGSSVSLTLVDSEGNEVLMPSGFEGVASLLDTTFTDVGTTARKNAEFLDEVMVKYGFTRIGKDKWYAYKDAKAEYTVDATLTLIGDKFTKVDKWLVECDSTLNLRKSATTSSSILKKIPTGTEVYLVGFIEEWAMVVYDGTIGMVKTTYLRERSEVDFLKQSEIVKPVQKYTYAQMEEDFAELVAAYPDFIRIDSIGKSEEGRELYIAILGDENYQTASKRIFINAGMHAREYLNPLLVMLQIEYTLKNLDNEYYNTGKTFREILDDTVVVVMPMVNPDGIIISQTEKVPAEFASLYSSSIYARNWKANAKGVDLNCNFDANWENYNGGIKSKAPAYMSYKGTAPECAAESKALVDYVRSENFDFVICYHESGSIIYPTFGNRVEVNEKCLEAASRFCYSSGYVCAAQGTSCAGFKDWIIDKMGIPALTIENGGSECPESLRELGNIWGRNKDAILISALWVSEGE